MQTYGKSSSRWAIQLVGLVILVLGVDVAVGASSNVIVSVVSYRPLEDALRCIGARYGCIINYEEPGYYDDVSRIRPVAPGRVFIPRERALECEFSLTNSVLDAIASALVASKVIDPAVEYVVITNASEKAVVTVLPERWLTASGVLSTSASVLNRRVTFATKEGEGAYSAITRLLAELLANGPHNDEVLVWGLAKRERRADLARNVSATNELAYEILNRLICLGDDRRGRNWGLLRMPECKEKWRTMLYVRDVQAATPNDRFVFVHSGRPVAVALRVVSKDLGGLVGHEEPELKSTGFLSASDGKPYGPTGVSMDFSYMSSWRSDAILNSMLDGVILGDCRLTVLRSDGAECVVPSKKIASLAKRAWVDYQPVVTNKVTFSGGQAKAGIVVGEICGQLGKASGRSVVLSSQSDRILRGLEAELKAEGVPAWIALTQYLRTLSQSLNWTLVHDPATDQYVLDVYDTKGPVVFE